MTCNVLVGVLTLAALPGFVASADDPPNSSSWFTDYAAARAEARKTGKPMLVVFR